MTRRLHEPTYLGGMNQRAPRQPEALSRDVQMPPSIQMANGLDMNYLARGRNFSSPASLTYGQLMNFRGMTLGAPSLIPLSLPITNLLVMSPNIQQQTVSA